MDLINAPLDHKAAPLMKAWDYVGFSGLIKYESAMLGRFSN